MIHNILVPTDFSNNAYYALHYASELLKNKACNFFILHVYNDKEISQNLANDVGNLNAEKCKARLERVIGRIRKSKENYTHTYSPVLEKGEFTEVVHSSIAQLKINLIVMGSKGKKSSIPVFLGSTATKTLESVKKCPVLVVPKKAKIKIPREIGFASDYKRPFGIKVIETIRFMAQLGKAAIHIIHIGEEEKLDERQQTNLNVLLGHLSTISHSVHHLPNFISKTKLIQIFLKDSDIDMLAMVNYRGGYLEKLLREPVIAKMVFYIDLPFLILPDYD